MLPKKALVVQEITACLKDHGDFILDTDASLEITHAVLFHVHDEVKHTVA